MAQPADAACKPAEPCTGQGGGKPPQKRRTPQHPRLACCRHGALGHPLLVRHLGRHPLGCQLAGGLQLQQLLAFRGGRFGVRGLARHLPLAQRWWGRQLPRATQLGARGSCAGPYPGQAPPLPAHRGHSGSGGQAAPGLQVGWSAGGGSAVSAAAACGSMRPMTLPPPGQSARRLTLPSLNRNAIGSIQVAPPHRCGTAWAPQRRPSTGTPVAGAPEGSRRVLHGGTRVTKRMGLAAPNNDQGGVAGGCEQPRHLPGTSPAAPERSMP